MIVNWCSRYQLDTTAGCSAKLPHTQESVELAHLIPKELL